MGWCSRPAGGWRVGRSNGGSCVGGSTGGWPAPLTAPPDALYCREAAQQPALLTADREGLDEVVQSALVVPALPEPQLRLDGQLAAPAELAEPLALELAAGRPRHRPGTHDDYRSGGGAAPHRQLMADPAACLTQVRARARPAPLNHDHVAA